MLGFTRGWDGCVMTCVHHCGITQSVFTARNILSASPARPPHCPRFSLRIPPMFLLFHSLPSLEYYGVKIAYVAFTDGLLSLRHTNVSFLHMFSWFHSSFLFLAMNTIPWFGWTTLYVSIQILNNILVASKFFPTLCYGCFVGLHFPRKGFPSGAGG